MKTTNSDFTKTTHNCLNILRYHEFVTNYRSTSLGNIDTRQLGLTSFKQGYKLEIDTKNCWRTLIESKCGPD